MLVATVILWINIFFTGLALAINVDGADGQQQQQQESISSSSFFVTECSKCAFCCTPYSECAYFDKTASFTCQPKTEEDAEAYHKFVEEAKQYMITAPPGTQPTIAPRAVVNTRKPPHRNGTSGTTMAMGKRDGISGLVATMVVAALVGAFML